MHRLFLLLATALASASLARAIDDTETIRQSLPAAAKLEVRNINGSIRVTGTTANGIELVATKRIHADDQAALTQAKSEVRLDLQSTGGVARVCVIQIWEDCSGSKNRTRCRNGECERDYTVSVDFELRVPVQTELDLTTINGDVAAHGTRGSFIAKTVNGGVTVEDIDGAGSAHTVNGTVKLSFAASPREAIDAKTVNGSIEAAFPKSLNANLHFKTFRGEVFTSFPTTAITEERRVDSRQGKTIIRGGRAGSSGNFGVQIGSGGPEHHFQTLNGTIQIAER